MVSETTEILFPSRSSWTDIINGYDPRMTAAMATTKIRTTTTTERIRAALSLYPWLLLRILSLSSDHHHPKQPPWSTTATIAPANSSSNFNNSYKRRTRRSSSFCSSSSSSSRSSSSSCSSRLVWLISIIIVSILSLTGIRVVYADNGFNSQVMSRVIERLEGFMQIPIDAAKRSNRFHSIGGFPNNMTTQDRDMIMQFFYMEYPLVVSYGLDDGSFVLYDSATWTAVDFREPGEGGYPITMNITIPNPNYTNSDNIDEDNEDQDTEEDNDSGSTNATTTTTTVTTVNNINITITTNSDVLDFIKDNISNMNTTTSDDDQNSTTARNSTSIGNSTSESTVNTNNNSKEETNITNGTAVWTSSISVSNIFADNDTNNTTNQQARMGRKRKQVSQQPQNITITVPTDNKFFKTCVNKDNGTQQDCISEPGYQYIYCLNDCELIPCPDEETQSAVTNANSSITDIKWCKNYEIREVQDFEVNTYGYIPRVKACINRFGLPEQRQGLVLINDTTSELGNCYYGDGKTLVERYDNGPFAYCQNEHYNEVCSALDDLNSNTTFFDNYKKQIRNCTSTFTGAYSARAYDPRYRVWYTMAREAQKPIWTDPYTYTGQHEIGITYSEPIYEMIYANDTTRTGVKRVFKGVLAVDYYLKDLNVFLEAQYKDKHEQVLIIEAEGSNYIIASSTASFSTKDVLKEDPTKDCPYADKTNAECEVARIPLANFSGDPMDAILRQAFTIHKAAKFPQDKLLNFTVNGTVGEKAYISQLKNYTQVEAKNLKWQVVVVIPMDRYQYDSVTDGPELITVVLIGFLGLFGCLGLFVSFYRKRKEKAMIHADWRFTCAFISGCSALNLSTFTLLGENTNPTCMLRMWSFNALFVSALSPLFVKVWRMHKLLKASVGFQRVNVTHFQAFLYTLPLIMLEIIILIVFSFADPPRQVEELGVGELGVQQITCQHNTKWFFWTQFVFDACLVFAGCVLAYKTRDLDPKFGEAKQLGFSMYNVAFTGLTVVLIINSVDLDLSTTIILQAIGVLWGSFFCSLSFVLPRLLEANKLARIHSNRKLMLTQSGNAVRLVSGASGSDGEDGQLRFQDRTSLQIRPGTWATTESSEKNTVFGASGLVDRASESESQSLSQSYSMINEVKTRFSEQKAYNSTNFGRDTPSDLLHDLSSSSPNQRPMNLIKESERIMIDVDDD